MATSITRAGILLLIAGAGLIALSGCSSYTYADAEATPFSVVETEDATLFAPSKFAYIDREGNQKPFKDCGKESIMDPYVCESEAGAVQFSYTVRKSSIYNTKVTYDGETYDMECNVNPDEFMSGLFICLPVS